MVNIIVFAIIGLIAAFLFVVGVYCRGSLICEGINPQGNPEFDLVWRAGWRRLTHWFRLPRLLWIVRQADRARTTDDYITAYKWATVVRSHSGEWRFQPFGVHHLAGVKDCYYRTEESARCFDRRGHRARKVPKIDCRCGFYGLKSPRLLGWIKGCTPYQRRQEQAALAVLRVDLSGLFIEARYGYRAQHQRVEQVAFGRHCGAWRKPGKPCYQPATGLALVKKLEAYGFTPVAPACARHADPELTLPELANQLATEVVWQP